MNLMNIINDDILEEFLCENLKNTLLLGNFRDFDNYLCPQYQETLQSLIRNGQSWHGCWTKNNGKTSILIIGFGTMKFSPSILGVFPPLFLGNNTHTESEGIGLSSQLWHRCHRWYGRRCDHCHLRHLAALQISCKHRGPCLPFSSHDHFFSTGSMVSLEVDVDLVCEIWSFLRVSGISRTYSAEEMVLSLQETTTTNNTTTTTRTCCILTHTVVFPPGSRGIWGTLSAFAPGSFLEKSQATIQLVLGRG